MLLHFIQDTSCFTLPQVLILATYLTNVILSLSPYIYALPPQVLYSCNLYKQSKGGDNNILTLGLSKA